MNKFPASWICLSEQDARFILTAEDIVGTASGYMARSLTRFRLPAWIIAVSTPLKTCPNLMFSYGVYLILEEIQPKDWAARVRGYVKTHGLKGSCFIKAEGPSPEYPEINHKLEIIEL